MKRFLFLIFLLVSSTVRAATITVNTTSDDNTTNGNCTLREAIRAANSNTAIDGCTAGSGTDTINLSAATYTLSIAGQNEDVAATGDLDITQSLNIQGVSSATTIINGNDIDRVFHIPSSGPTLSLSNLTVRNGDPGNTGGSGNGGAGVMVASGATLNVSNCIFSDHSSVLGTSVGGGAIDSQGAFNISSSEFYDNVSQNDGAIRCLATCTGTIVDTSIHDNTATGYVGGGIGAAGNLSLLRVQILNNVNEGPGGAGGLSCLSLNGTNVITVTDSIIAGNTSVTDAGGVGIFDIPGFFDGAANVTITNTTITGNSAQGAGGGIFVRTSTGQLNNVTITNNTSDSDNNSGSNQGGGIYRASGTLRMRNSLVANNFDTGASANNVDCSGTITTQGYNLVRYASACTGIVNGESGDITGVNPQLSVLASNGGSTQTHAIGLTSPALNAGNPAGCAGASGNLTADQRGVSRTGQGNCDIGAFEFSCGFGTVDATAGEQCDDSNNTTEACTYGLTSCSVCNASCQTVAGAVTYCGDGVIQGGSGETCDDGNAVTETCAYGLGSCTVCNSSCQTVAGAVSTCGDGVVQVGNGETCDDGNAVTESCAYGLGSCTVCAGNCQSVAGAISSCGDGVVQSGEDCDDLNSVTEACDYGEGSCTVCNADCELVAGETALCGDGDIQGSEACDDGNITTESCIYGQTSCTVCAANCTITSGLVSYCGDGVVQAANGESCDEGAQNGEGTCFTNCQRVQIGGTSTGSGGTTGTSTSGATTTTRSAAAAACSLSPNASYDLSWVYLMLTLLLVVRKRMSA